MNVAADNLRRALDAREAREKAQAYDPNCIKCRYGVPHDHGPGK